MDNQLFKTDIEVNKAIESLRNDVKEILESESKDYYSSKFINMTKNFMYLQQLNKHYNKGNAEYEEAKRLIESINEKDSQFVEYFKQFVNEK